MPVKKTAAKKKVKKVVPKKKAAPKKKAVVKKPQMVCGVCGMEVTIDRACGCAEAHPIICCGQAMASK